MPTVSIPDTTDPKTTCFPSRNGVCAVQMKNWDPFVFGPAFAIDNVPGSYKSFMLSRKRYRILRPFEYIMMKKVDTWSRVP